MSYVRGGFSRVKNIVEGRSNIRVLATVIGGALLVLSVIPAAHTIRFAAAAESATGRLEFVNERGRRGRVYYRASFNPSTPPGPQLESLRRRNAEREGRASPSGDFIFTSIDPLLGLLHGQTAPVLYNPSDPNEAVVDTFSSLYAYSILMLAAGTPLTLWGMWKRRK